MAENPKQRFRRVLNDLSQDDRTFLDSGLRRIYSESLSYGLKNNFLTKEEVTKYQTLAQQRDTALRKVNVLDPQGNPISKETTVPVMRNGQVVQEKRVTPVTPFDLLRKTGGQMDGGPVEGPLFTGYTLDTGAPIGAARKKFQEEVIPTAQKAATELEKTKGQTKFYQPGTQVGLLAGGLASIPIGIEKAVTAPLAAGVSRGIGLFDPEASRQFDESIARAYYPEATIDVSQPFKTGVDVGQIAGIKAAEAIPSTIAATIAGTAAAIPASFATTPVGGAIVGTGVGMATAYGTGQAQNFLTELALGSSYKPAAQGIGFDLQRSPLSEARARFTQERTELAPSAAFAGEFAPNLLMGTPTLPKGFLGGAKAGFAATRLGQEGRAALTAASMPAAESLAGRIAATPVMQAGRAIGQRLERIPGVGAAATFGRGFAQSEPGREFLSDIAERGVEGSADLYFALKENADKPADQRDPMWMILGKTALGSMFEGQHKLGTKLNAPGQALGMAAVRKLDERMGTFTPEAYTSLAPPVVPSATGTTPAGATATPRVPSPFTFGKTRVTGASTPLPTLDEGVVPIGGGMVARIAPTGEATVESAPQVDYDRTPASSPSVGRNVLDALGGVAPKSNLLSVGNIGRVGTRFGTVQSQGGESQLFFGLTHDGLVMVKATDKKTGESSIDLVSPDLLIGDNKRIAREAFKAGNLTPSDKTGYQRKDYDVELSRTADYEPTSEGEGPSSKDFDKEIRVSKNPIFGRVVKAIDENFSVMQIPSPVGGFDMMVVPNDTVTGLKRGQRAVAGEVLDTTSMNLDMSAYRVDRGKYDPIFKGDSKQRITGATHPIMLTPEQVADAATRKTNLGNFRNQLKAEGRAEGDVNTQYNAARDKAYADLRKGTPKAENDYAVGSTIDFTAADGEVSKGVVVGNTAYGPTVVDVANPMSPAFTVQEPQIVSSSAEPTVKPEPEKKTATKPKAEKKAPVKKEPVKKAEPKAETKPETPKVEPKPEVKPEPVKPETPKEEPEIEPTKVAKPKAEKKVEPAKAEVTPTPKVEPEVPKAEVAPTPTVAVEPEKVEAPMPSGVPVSGYGVTNPKEVAELIGEKRFELGKKLTAEQRKKILGKVGDSYVDQRHQKELAGVDNRGEEMYKYPYSTGHMYVSNITGKFIRYYVVIPADITEGLIGVKRDIFAHPSELFPDISSGKAVELARTQRSSQLRQLLINANELQLITDDEFSKAINLLPRYVEEKLKENSTKVIEDILTKAEAYNTPSQEVETLAKAIRDNASAGIPDFISQSLRDSLMGDELSKKIAYKALNGIPFDKNWNGAVIAGKARVKREAQAPTVEPEKVEVPEEPKPVVKPTATFTPVEQNVIDEISDLLQEDNINFGRVKIATKGWYRFSGAAKLRITQLINAKGVDIIAPEFGDTIDMSTMVSLYPGKVAETISVGLRDRSTGRLWLANIRAASTSDINASNIEAAKPIVKPTISSADLIGESDITPSDEGSALNVTLPGDVQVLDDDGSLVRVQASIEGLEDINDVFRKARNVDELRDVLRGVIKDAGILKSPADIDAAADKLSKYYDEWLRAFVNRDLLIAQQYAQGIRKFASDETSGSQTRYGIDEEEITVEDTPQAAKQKRIRNRVARLYQAYDMPRIGQVVDLLNTEASKKVLVKQPDGTYEYATGITFFDKTLTASQKSDVVAKVQAMMLRERYRTNMPVFSVMSKAPQISEAFDKSFVGEGAYVNIKNKDSNVGQQVVFITTNQADVSTIVEELSHAILENMPIDMARQVATKFGKTLREPTTTNESIASYELQEMFAARMRLSLATGENAFTKPGESKKSQARLSNVWNGIRSFMADTYKAIAGDIADAKLPDAAVTQWSVPYNPETISLWDKAPILFTDDDGKVKWGQIQPTDKYKFGPGMVSAKNLEKPIVNVKMKDGTVKDIKPVQVLAISDMMTDAFSPQFGNLILKFVSGSKGANGTSVVGLIDSYDKVTKAIQDNSYEGLLGKVDNFIDSALFDYRLAKESSSASEQVKAPDLLMTKIPNLLQGIVNQANRYGVLSDVDNDPNSPLSLKNWLNAIGTLRAGEGLNEKSAFAKFYKKDADFWVQSNIKKLQTAIRDAKEYAGALEGKGLFDDDAYHIDAGNTGGNLLYSSRQIGDSSEKNRALADGQASTLNPDAVTPVDFAMTATQQGMPREVVTPVVQERVIADAERNGLANSNIRLLEINDVLVIDGTVNISDAGIDTISKAIDFAARNNVQNTILVTKAAPNEELGYNANKGYSVEPSVTFQFEDPIADNVYAFIKRMHPYVRKSIDGQSLTIHNIEQKGKSYEESLNVFEQATSRIAKELAKRRIPVQAIQDTERVWNFGNESAQGYAVPYYEARNLLHLINPQVLETGQRPVSDPRIKDVLQTALSTVAGRNIKLPDIDFSSVPDNHERRLAMGSNYDKLPTNSYDTNPETKEAYDSLMSELDRQFSYLKMTASVDDSRLTALHKYGKHFLSEPVPPGMVRRVHYTKSKEALDSIAENGIRLSNAKGETYGEPNFVWSNESSLKAYEDMNFKPLVEFWEDPSKIKYNQQQLSDVKPEQVIAIHNGPMSFHLKDMVDDLGLNGSIELLERQNLTKLNTQSEPYKEVYEALLEIRAKRDAAPQPKYKVKSRYVRGNGKRQDISNHPLMAQSKHKDVNGIPLRYIDLLDAVHDSISDSVKLASGGEHSDLMAFAAHSAITKDPKAIRALYTETLGRKVYEQLSGKDVHKAALPTVEDTKTGIVALDKRVQALYAETKSPYGDLKKNEVTNGMGRVQYASGGGTPLYSLRPIRDVDVSDTGEPEVASEENPVIVVDDAGTEVAVTEESRVSKVLNFLDKNPVTRTFDVLNALGRFTMAGDWSAPLVQNWQLANPIESPGLFFKSLLFGPKSLAPNLAIDTGKGGINKNAFLGRKQVHDMGNEIRSHRFYELAKEMKLSLATAEYDRLLAEKRAEREAKLAQMRERDPEATLPEIDLMDIDELDVDPDMMGLLSAERHIPGKAASERAMTMMKDFVKFNKFTQALETYEQLGYDPSSEGFKEMASDMAAVLNVMNGDVRFTANEYDKSIGRLMRRVMFAPRWLTSRVLTNPLMRLAIAQGEPGRKWLEANNLPTGRTINPYALRANIRMVLKAQALWYALLAYFGLMRPFDQFQVKTSVDHMFTRIQVGNYVFKAPGGSMMLLEIADGFYGGDYKNLPPDEARKRFAERMETLVMGRLVNSPGIGIIKEMITGRDFMGKPVGYVDPDLEAYWRKVVKPTMAEIGVPVPDMKLSKLITKNLQYLWLQSYLETFKLADDREEDDKMFEAAFVGGMSALGGRIRYNPPAGKGSYDYDTYGNPPGIQYYILGANREEWLMNPASNLSQEQLDAMEKEVVE